VGRNLLWASLALGPIAVLARFVFDADDTLLFILAAAALVPLAWLIGEATEHAGEHTGAGVGGFLNASFGNAPELIIAIFAISNGLPDVVRGSITGSVVSNILLVLGFALLVHPGEGKLDRRSLWWQLALVFGACLAFLVVAVPSWTGGDPERHSLAVLTVPVSIVLLIVYFTVTVKNLRVHKAKEREDASAAAWSLSVAIGVLIVATIMTAFVSEIMVHSLEAFSHRVGLSEFFISAVVVAIVGNAAEHGGAVVIAHRGKIKLASEIAIASSAQVAVFVAPAIALISWIVRPPLPLTFRPIEIISMAGAALFVAFVVADGKSRRWEGAMLIGVYVCVATAYAVAGDR
jgi:Ca2+:H+ antiporter